VKVDSFVFRSAAALPARGDHLVRLVWVDACADG
jgi:hypothetical protein